MPLRDDLLNPIAGPNPAGESLEYDPIYKKIDNARKDNPFQDPPLRADWRVVVEQTSEILARRSKDLQLAAWLTEGLLRREGISGLRQGLDVVNRLLAQFWDHLYPSLEDGLEARAGRLRWLGSYLDAAVRLAPVNASGHTFMDYSAAASVPTLDECRDDDAKAEARTRALQDGKFDPDVFDKGFRDTPKAWYKQLVSDLETSLDLIDSLEKIGDERMRDDAPSFRGLRNALQEFQATVSSLLARKLELDPDPIAETPAEDFGSSSSSATEVISLVPRNRDDAGRRIAAAARFLREEAPTDPASYLLLRGFRWGELRAGGHAQIDPMMLAAPPVELRTRLRTMLLRMEWKSLLDTGEEVMGTPIGRGWLDLQRYVLTATEGLGPDYAAVGSSIRGSLRDLLRDLPGLPDATLMDDLPTANGETRKWLRESGLLAQPGEAPAEEHQSAAATPSAPSADAIDRTLRGLGTAQPQRAIELLLRAAAQEKSERARFLRRSEAARIMVSTGMETVAVPMLQDLLTAIDQHRLEEWESGDTIALPLGLLYRCLEKLDGDHTLREALYVRVCRLDPLQAMQFAGSVRHDDSGA
jgi:type VI secretion system protein ImpA